MTKKAREDQREKRKPYRPEGPVHLDAKTLRHLSDEGLDFRRDVERRAAAMFVPSTPAASRSRQR